MDDRNPGESAAFGVVGVAGGVWLVWFSTDTLFPTLDIVVDLRCASHGTAVEEAEAERCTLDTTGPLQMDETLVAYTMSMFIEGQAQGKMKGWGFLGLKAGEFRLSRHFSCV